MPAISPPASSAAELGSGALEDASTLMVASAPKFCKLWFCKASPGVPPEFTPVIDNEIAPGLVSTLNSEPPVNEILVMLKNVPVLPDVEPKISPLSIWAESSSELFDPYRKKSPPVVCCVTIPPIKAGRPETFTPDSVKLPVVDPIADRNPVFRMEVSCCPVVLASPSLTVPNTPPTRATSPLPPRFRLITVIGAALKVLAAPSNIRIIAASAA